jgi:hypothetical protein
MRAIHIVWICFGVALLGAAITQWRTTDPTDDSGGPCCGVASVVFLLLLALTAYDNSAAERRERKQHGFDVISPEDRKQDPPKPDDSP